MERNSNPIEDYSVNVFSVMPRQPNNSEAQVSDDDKAGATLLFSGVLLGLVGITFTVMGWVKYKGVSHFEWTQLLGPILLSVGVTFLLISVCKFKMLTCKPCSEREERTSGTDQTPHGQSFIFTGISQPITFHGATVVQYIPSYPAQESLGITSANFHQVCSHHGLLPSSGTIIPGPSTPQYYNVYPLDNFTLSVDENPSAYRAVDPRSEWSTDSVKEPKEVLDEDVCCDFSPPPYDKLFPLFVFWLRSEGQFREKRGALTYIPGYGESVCVSLEGKTVSQIRNDLESPETDWLRPERSRAKAPFATRMKGASLAGVAAGLFRVLALQQEGGGPPGSRGPLAALAKDSLARDG
uniref:transmembrane protein 174 n=1 Tax=Euleptes europaea TaxID=460621 RepID=UPI00254024DC|nr:transmembrane protein 174 [Euleptes europaea]